MGAPSLASLPRLRRDLVGRLAMTVHADPSAYPETRTFNEEYGITILDQDNVAHDEFPFIRKMRVSRTLSGYCALWIDLFKKPPREYPPMHAGDATAGMNLTREQTVMLRDYLNFILETT
jgi:hypothetical protein